MSSRAVLPVAVGIVIAVLAAAASGAESPNIERIAAGEEPHERLDDSPARPDEIASKTAGSKTVIEHNGFVSYQVNVGDGGVNIEGDAANEPSIAVDPTAPLRIAIGWRQFDTISSNFRQAGVGWSSDGGRNWNFPGVFTPGIFRSDPVLGADAEGRFYYYSLKGDFSCDFFFSDDGGESWTDPLAAFGADKQWFTIDTTDGPGRGAIYVTWSLAGNNFGDRVFIRSTDGGQTFTVPIALTPAPIWGSLTVGPDGELYAAGNQEFFTDQFVVQRSFDAWNPLVPTPTFEAFFPDLGGDQRAFSALSPNPGGLTGQVWIDADRGDGLYRGNVYIVSSVDPDGLDPMDVHFIRSEDRGETFSSPVRVNVDDRDAWQWFGTMSVAPNGRIDVVWVESETFAAPNIGGLYYAFSDDAGFTWSVPASVSPSFNSFFGWPSQNKLGDYYHMVSDNVGAHLAYAATFNDEQDVYYLRIGDTDCNGNSIGDTIDLDNGYVDCNDNAVLDSCEIAADTAEDADGDGVIDECRVGPRTPQDRLEPVDE